MTDNQNISNIVWGFADALYPAVERADYHRIILPLVLIRRFDFFLAPYRAVTAEMMAAHGGHLQEDGVLNDAMTLNMLHASIQDAGLPMPEGGDLRVYNVSPLTFEKLLDDSGNILANIDAYLDGFSDNVKDILSNFELKSQLKKLHAKGKLIPLMRDFTNADFLRTENLSNNAMGTLYEELIRKWADTIKAAAGEFFTPRDIVKLLVELVFVGGHIFVKKGAGTILRSYDPTAGSGGMLTVADEEDIVSKYFPKAKHLLHGQELKELPYAICKADMLLKGKDDSLIRFGNTLTSDAFPDETFNFQLSNPPYGTPWASDEAAITAEHQLGKNGRFQAGLPRKDDGSMLFIQHLISKMDPKGGRVGIVLAGSPLFNGDAGSGESEIRRWILENDYLETLVALPTDLFFDTGIGTYLWILTNKKEERRRGQVQLIDAREVFEKMRKGVGMKRREITDACREALLKCWTDYTNCPISKVYDNEFFGYRKVCIERPFRFEASTEALTAGIKQLKVFLKGSSAATKSKKWSDAEVVSHFLATGPFIEEDGQRYIVLSDPNSTANRVADPSLRDYETVPLSEHVGEYFAREVAPHVPDAWVDESYVDAKDGKLGKVGYEINFNRYFYVYQEPEAPEALKLQIEKMEEEFVTLMKGVLK